jgi:hypothetical protein
MRKTIEIEIESDDRDYGKRFLITEMAADQAERWAIRFGFALMNSGVDLPELDGGITGMSDLLKVGLKALAKVPYEKAEPLITEMMDCVQFMPDAKNKKIVRDLFENDIEEVTTRLKLKKAVFDLHTSFFTAAVPSTSE